jgi:GT2 family glycosyltransferase
MTSDRLRISVVIVNYRAYDELADCLKSLLELDGPDLEVLVVDHATDDGAMQPLVVSFPKVRFIGVSDNPGFAAGVNRAARHARGRYLLLLNPDCLIAADVMRQLEAWLDNAPGVGVAAGVIRDADGSIQASARRFPTLSTAFAGRSSWLSRTWPGNPWSRRNLIFLSDPTAPVYVDWVSGACMMVRREAFDAIQGMDEHFFLYWEDADFCRRLKNAGWSTVYTPFEGVVHLTGRSSAAARVESLRAFHNSAFYYLTKHGGRIARIVAPVVWLGLRARLIVTVARQLRKQRQLQRQACR